MARPTRSPSFTQSDPRIVRSLGPLQRLALLPLPFIAGFVLLAWVVPPLGHRLPPSWPLMKANSALLVLASGLSLVLTRPLRPTLSVNTGRLLGFLVTLLSAVTLAEYSFGWRLGVDTLFATDPLSLFPGRMALQTAFSFLLVGIVLVNVHARKGAGARIANVSAVLLLMSVLVYAAGYFFGALRLFGVTPAHRLSPQTLICLALLMFMIFIRRIEYGSFSIFIDDGIGGKTARLTAPCALFLPFALAELRGIAMRFHLIQEQYSVALASALVALVGLGFVVFLARRCQQLEGATRELSLRDQLTRLYNRRGFLLFAEQNLRLARRGQMEFFLLFLDIDGLKKLNDTLGHEAGSQQLQHMARLLESAFRETDVIGRLGGDEFVVAGYGSSGHATDFLTRLERAIQHEKLLDRTIEPELHPLSFSLGQVTVQPDNTETLAALIDRADVNMYEVKRSKKDTRVYEGAETGSLQSLPTAAVST